MPRILSGIFYLSLFLLLSGQPLHAISDEDLNKMGQEYQHYLIQAYGEYPSPALKNYLQVIFKKMLASHPALLSKNYQLSLLDDSQFNASSIPPNFVFINRGILPYLNSEAELVAILGHEIGHIENQHSKKNIESQESGQLFSNIFSVGTAVFLKNQGMDSNQAIDMANLAKDLSGGALALANMHYSRENEFEADQSGIQFLQSTGYDARQAIVAFNHMKRYAESQGANERRFDFGASHPPSEERMEKLREFLKDYQPPARALIGREEYLKAIDGIAWGPDQNAGFQSGDTLILGYQGLAYRKPAFHQKIEFGKEVVLFGSYNDSYDNALVAVRTVTDNLSLQVYAEQFFSFLEDIDEPEKLTPVKTSFRQIPAVQYTFEMNTGSLAANLLIFRRQHSLFVVFYTLPYEHNPDLLPHSQKKFKEILNNLYVFKPHSVPNPKIKLLTIQKNETLDQLVLRLIKLTNLERQKIIKLFPESPAPEMLNPTHPETLDYFKKTIQLLNDFDEFPAEGKIKVPWLTGYAL